MGYSWKFFRRSMSRYTWRWLLGLSYIFAVAIIWIAASYTVQSVVDAGVSPFLVTYICNSLFLIYIPLIEFGRCIMGSDKKHITDLHGLGSLENVNLLQDIKHNSSSANPSNSENGELSCTIENCVSGDQGMTLFDGDSKKVVEERIWTRFRLAKISLFVSPFWFIGQLTFNLSLKYTTVTSNTVLSSASSLFTFLVSLAFFGEKFTLIKLISVILCMGGTILVSLSDSSTSVNAVATNPLVGDILALVSAGLYAVYINIIREKLPDDIDGGGQASTAQFLGYLGFFNLLIFLPVAIVLDFGNLEPFHMLTWKQFGLIVSKGLLDNVLSDYLQVKATQLTSTTVATAGLSIQVPIAAVVDSFTGRAPHLLEYLGAAAVMFGFVGINIPSDAFDSPQETAPEQDAKNAILTAEIELGREIVR
ncbi:hypothetical protein HPP92_026551 [Vanilla planifolia]|uniref:EamA domain-containing protein n=1 Tax=Vanilla planifolia TaxID=51239 RepID=A0A835PGX4_VANPL|nr:hypothetical protein HPP92_026551 [Vanilla planifolia]